MKFKLLIAVVLLGCKTEEALPPRPPPVIGDSSNFCLPAEINLKTHKCIPNEKYYTKGRPGKSEPMTFESFCKYEQENGIFLNPECLSKIVDCNEVNKCTYSKK